MPRKGLLSYTMKNNKIRSYLLVAESTVGAKHITTTLVEMEPGGIQKPHHHETEQCYMILEGKGKMGIDGEKTTVKAGDTIFIPSNSLHSLINDGATNAMIGRELYPLLRAAGFSSIHVSPRMVYVDSGKPDLVEGFTKNTFTAMIEGIRNAALKAGIVDQLIFDKGIQDLYRTAEAGGVFCYTFFKAFATKK